MTYNKKDMEKYRKDNKEKIQLQRHSYYEKNKDKIREHRNKNSIRIWATTTLSSHKLRRGCIINISSDELTNIAKTVKTCPICGTELDWSYGSKKSWKRNSPSLDRMNIEKEININNIDIICFKCNVSKQDRTIQQTVQWCLDFIEYAKTKSDRICI